LRAAINFEADRVVLPIKCKRKIVAPLFGLCWCETWDSVWSI